MDDSAVARALAEGDYDAAATGIVRAHGPGILGYLVTLLGELEVARDAFSDFAEALWKSLPRFAARSSAKTWAYAIAYRCALRQRRARARRRTRPLRESEYSRIAAEVATAASRSFSRTAAEQKLDVLRRALRPEEHTLLVLRIDRGMAWDEIATVLGLAGPAAATTLRKRFERLKGRLRTLAEREGLLS
jgi:RNA polymerase sigma-70 factor (ECF subfamily)